MPLTDNIWSVGLSVIRIPLLSNGGNSQILFVDQNSKQNQAAAKIWPFPYVVYISVM